MKKPQKEITQFIIRKGLCLKCLTHGHMSKENKCESVPSCAKPASPNLHMDKKNNTDDAERPNPEAAAKCSQASSAESPHTSDALITSQSNVTFITEQLIKSLMVDGVKGHLQLSTLHKEDEIIQCKKVQGLVVADLKNKLAFPYQRSIQGTLYRINLPKFLSLKLP